MWPGMTEEDSWLFPIPSIPFTCRVEDTEMCDEDGSLLNDAFVLYRWALPIGRSALARLGFRVPS